MQPPTITVSGTSSLHHPAELGIATLLISSQSDSQDRAFHNVRSASTSLKALLNTLCPTNHLLDTTPVTGAPVSKWTNSSLSTSSHLVRNDPRHDATDTSTVRRHTARMSFTVHFRDFSRLGAVATQLSTMEHVSIERIEWRLTEATKAAIGAEGRVGAMRDAVARARDYFEAMAGEGVLDVGADGEGERGIRAAEVVEGHGNLSSRGRVDAMRFMSSTRMGGGVEEEGIDFAPEDVHCECQITVKFEVV